MKISAFIATSLDGYIARSNGDIDWLIENNNSLEGEDFGYSNYYDSVSCIVIGRNTYEKVLDFEEWPYEGKHVIILSETMKELPLQHLGKATLFSGSIDLLMEQLENERESHIYVDGGKTIQSFIRSNHLNEITITRVPILLGSGLPLFGEVKADLHLKHIKTEAYLNGFVQSTYGIK